MFVHILPNGGKIFPVFHIVPVGEFCGTICLDIMGGLGRAGPATPIKVLISLELRPAATRPANPSSEGTLQWTVVNCVRLQCSGSLSITLGSAQPLPGRIILFETHHLLPRPQDGSLQAGGGLQQPWTRTPTIHHQPTQTRPTSTSQPQERQFKVFIGKF